MKCVFNLHSIFSWICALLYAYIFKVDTDRKCLYYLIENVVTNELPSPIPAIIVKDDIGRNHKSYALFNTLFPKGSSKSFDIVTYIKNVERRICIISRYATNLIAVNLEECMPLCRFNSNAIYLFKHHMSVARSLFWFEISL